MKSLGGDEAKEVATLKGNGGFVKGRLVAHRTGDYSADGWSPCKKGSTPREQSTISGFGEVASSTLKLAFLGGNKDLDSGEAGGSSFRKHRVRKRT